MVKVVKATGLVPVFEPKNASHIFGVTPAVAGEGFLNKTLVLVEIPDSIKTEEVHIPEIDDADKDNAKRKSGEAVIAGGEIEIPVGWEDQHWMKNDKLAKTIAGDTYLLPDGTKAVDYNDTIIREEIQRRADAKDAGEGKGEGGGTGTGDPLKTTDVTSQQL